MAAEESSLLALLDLFDSYWFEHQIFKKKTMPIVLEKCEEVLEKHEVLEFGDEPKLSHISILHVRSFSDQFLSSQESLDFLSPDSVLQTPEKKLQTIRSGKDAGEFPEPEAKRDQKYYNKEEKKVSSEGNTWRRGRKSKGVSSKSLSDLEFEELKGFMDLGFVFSEEDKNSSLVEIIPGLQRFGQEEEEKKKKNKEEAIDKEESTESFLRRPYLSEAWEIMEQREATENMLKWRININAAVIGNEMDMKDQLRFWAQSVASAVK